MRVIVTRPRAQARPLVAAGSRRSALEVVECPLIEIERTSDEPIDGAGYDWLVVTSPNGADEIARRGRNLPRVAAVGPGTAEALRAHGIEPAFVPRESSQDGLLREFPRPAGPRALRGRRGRAARRRSTSSAPTSSPLYRTRLLAPEPPEGDVVVLASGLGRARVRGDRRRGAGGHDRARDVARRPRRRARASRAEAATHDLDGLVAAVRGSDGVRSAR